MLTTLLLALAPALVRSAPDHAPQITSLKFSGTGCPNDSGSVKAVYGELGAAPSFTFTELKGSDTDNCELHIQSAGGSPGWQVAVQEVTYQGYVTLTGGSQLDTITQAFWSENAGSTAVLNGQIACTSGAIKDYVTVKSSTADLKWSKCTGADGSPGILNVNARPVVQGNSGSYDIKKATWGLLWRKC